MVIMFLDMEQPYLLRPSGSSGEQGSLSHASLCSQSRNSKGHDRPGRHQPLRSAPARKTHPGPTRCWNPACSRYGRPSWPALGFQAVGEVSGSEPAPTLPAQPGAHLHVHSCLAPARVALAMSPIRGLSGCFTKSPSSLSPCHRPAVPRPYSSISAWRSVSTGIGNHLVAAAKTVISI